LPSQESDFLAAGNPASRPLPPFSKTLLRQGLTPDAAAALNSPAMRATRAADNLAKIPSFFPAGSGTGDTKALPVVWTDRATFDSRASDALREARALQAIAASGNRAGLEAGLRTLGAACTACHDRFRAS
jgi:cytochrome c556